MALKQRHRAAKSRQMVQRCDSNREKRKYNSEVSTATWLPPQYANRQVLKFRQGTYLIPLGGPLVRIVNPNLDLVRFIVFVHWRGMQDGSVHVTVGLKKSFTVALTNHC